jgi:hypothetical protein
MEANSTYAERKKKSTQDLKLHLTIQSVLTWANRTSHWLATHSSTPAVSLTLIGSDHSQPPSLSINTATYTVYLIHTSYEDGTDRGFRNVDIFHSGFGELPKRKKHSTNIILPVVFYGCTTWSLPLREEPRLRVLENMVLRGIFGPKRDGVTGEWSNYIMRSLMICTPRPIFFGW